jgi:hypothetical protein
MSVIDVFVDESGNLGTGRGRYFTIALVSCERSESKRLRRSVKKQALKTKQAHPQKTWHNGEVKASNLSWPERIETIKKICERDVHIFDITADKDNLQPQMFEHKSATYNYWIKLVVDDLVKYYSDIDEITFYIDRRAIRVESFNSFLDYITIHLLYEMNQTGLHIYASYPESQTDYGIQAADFVSNAVNSYHQTFDDSKVSSLRPSIIHEQHFPYRYFGQ